jgi:flagella basal body P-ring formation protein FlgA
VIDPYAPTSVENTDKSAGKSISALASDMRTSDVRGAICAKLTELYGVAADSIRLTFRGSEDALLSTNVEGMQVTIQPAGGGKSVPVQVRVFRGDEVIASGTVRVGVEIQRSVLISVSPIDRAEPISAANTMLDTRWLTPDVKPVPAEEAYGAVALSRIESGAVVESRAVKAPNVVAKGEIVRIDCLSGGIALQAQARALEHGKQGQVIQFQSLNSKKIFRARVSGEGSAVADLGSR